MHFPRKIYLVEDKTDQITLIKEAVKKLRVENDLTIIKSGYQAMSVLENKQKCIEKNFPKLIILDINIPAPDGFEILKAVKSDKIIKSVPVIVFTSSHREEDVRKCYRLGANSYVIKPALFRHFAEKITEIIKYWLYVNVSPPIY